MSAIIDPYNGLSYAKADLRAAGNLLNSEDYSTSILHSQQAIEKSLKALIVAITGKRPPFVHEARLLLGHIQGIEAPKSIIAKAIDIDPYYILTRYPEESSIVFTEDRARTILDDAREVSQWCTAQLNVITSSKSS